VSLALAKGFLKLIFTLLGKKLSKRQQMSGSIVTQAEHKNTQKKKKEKSEESCGISHKFSLEVRKM
jgi:hypothetical protein